MKKISVLLFIIMLNSCENKDILNIGHRGAKGHIAENTLESIQKAIDLGVDGVEIDVFRCASGEIVVFHDKKLDRLTDSTGFIEEMTIDSLNNVLVEGKYKIPTLEEVLTLIDGNILLNVELKGKNTAEKTALILKNFVSNTQWEANQLIVSSFNWDELTIFKTQKRKLSRAAIETLSIIAYQQPITRSEIENIRGVQMGRGSIDHLMEIGWIKPSGRKNLSLIHI